MLRESAGVESVEPGVVVVESVAEAVVVEVDVVMMSVELVEVVVVDAVVNDDDPIVAMVAAVRRCGC